MAAAISLFAVSFIVALVADLMPFHAAVKSVLATSQKATRTIASKGLEDSEKQAMLLANSLNIFAQSVKMLLYLVLIAGVGFLLLLAAGYLVGGAYMNLLAALTSVKGVIISMAAFISYFLCRKMYAKQDYNFFDRLLHRCALQWPAIAEISFDIENSIVNKKGTFRDDHVFISGLARSGTTILTQYIYKTGRFRSLTYRDMPFVLMPNTWKKLSFNQSNVNEKERAHADSIMVSPDSPEEFDEVFWRVFCGRDYIKKDRLVLGDIDDAVLKKFADYIKNILASGTVGQCRYLSKNNNNILRFSYLQKYFPNSHIVVPFREPLTHAASLLNQHVRFSEIQSHDKFSLDYMNWLGHFEFGLNQKPFYLGDEDTFNKMEGTDKNDISYWLLSWKNYYGYMLNRQLPNVLFFCFEDFCNGPKDALTRLFEKLNIDSPVEEYHTFEPPARADFSINSSLLEDCNRIYEQIKASAI